MGVPTANLGRKATVRRWVLPDSVTRAKRNGGNLQHSFPVPPGSRHRLNAGRSHMLSHHDWGRDATPRSPNRALSCGVGWQISRGRRDSSATRKSGFLSYPVKAESEPGGPLVGCSPVLRGAAVTAHPPFCSIVLIIRVHPPAVLASTVAARSILVGHVKFSLVLLDGFHP